ncbi:hypothetical protein AAFN47_00010 [Hoeflea sp. CAU 1731]
MIKRVHIILPAAGILATIHLPAYAGSASYYCELTGIFEVDQNGSLAPWSHPWSDQAKEGQFTIDRESGKVINPVVNTNAYGSVEVLDPGSGAQCLSKNGRFGFGG